MSKEPEPGVIGSLPRTRPHRRSDKRAAPVGAPPLDTQAREPGVVKAVAAPKPKTARKTAPKKTALRPRPAQVTRAAAKPAPAAAKPPPAPPLREPAPGVLETAVQAAAELAEIGLHAGARALRRAVARLPRP